MKIIAFILWLYLMGVPGTNGEEVSCQMELISVVQEESANNRPLHLFGGQNVGVALHLACFGEQERTQLEARLYAVAQGLAAELPPSQILGFLHSGKAEIRHQHVEIALPEVSARTEIEVQFQATTSKGSHHLGSVRCFVYPEKLAEPLHAWATAMQQRRGRTIGVFGKRSELREFLQLMKIPFTDLGEELPASLSDQILLLGDAESGMLALWQSHLPDNAKGSIVVFLEDPEELPGVFPATSGKLRITKVTLPILKQLGSMPLHQTLLMRILLGTH